MARRKDLTALAALGTLGYMLSKRGDKASDKKDEKSTSDAAERRRAADKEASEEPLKVGDEFGMDPEEAANRRTERMLTNPNAKEYGEAGTSMTVSPSKKPAASPAKPAPSKSNIAPAPKAPAYVQSYTEDMMDADNPRSVKTEKAPAAASVDVTKLSLADRRKLSRENSSGSGPTDTRSVNQRMRESFGLKRGGKVKKMASGGMTSKVSSASKRADGIATKGKTRGKMY
jgi:hypothetical protein